MLNTNAIKPGDITKYSIKVKTNSGTLYDITRACLKVIIYQDILSPFWSGSVNISDTSNMLTTLPLEPGCKISVTWGTEFDVPNSCKGTRTIDFYLERITDRKFINQALTTYTLRIVTKEYFIDKSTRISGRLPATKPSEYPEKILSSLIEKYLPSYSIKETIDKNSFKAYSINANNWSLFYTTSFLSKITILDRGFKTKTSDFLFFKTGDTEFRFESLENLFTASDNSLGFEIIQKPSNLKDDQGNNPDAMLTMIDFKIDHFTAGDLINSGAQGSRVLSFDLVNKTLKFSDFSRGDDNKNDLEKNPVRSELMIDSAANANIIFQPKHLGVGTGDINDLQDDWIASRRSSLLSLEENKLTAQLYGSICALNWIGKTIKVKFPKLQDTMNQDTQDKKYTGTYIITQICHDIGPDLYTMNLGLAKKRFE